MMIQTNASVYKVMSELVERIKKRVTALQIHELVVLFLYTTLYFSYFCYTPLFQILELPLLRIPVICFQLFLVNLEYILTSQAGVMSGFLQNQLVYQTSTTDYNLCAVYVEFLQAATIAPVKMLDVNCHFLL
jgi:hypothetical protein